MAIETNTRIAIYPGENWYYTVEDKNIDSDLNGCTISYWANGNRQEYITMLPDEAIALADAIYKLFKKN